MEIEDKLRQYILENFMYSDDRAELSAGMSLFENNIVDSTGVLELVSFVEEVYQIKVDDTDLVPDNFDSIAKLAAYVRGKLPPG